MFLPFVIYEFTRILEKLDNYWPAVPNINSLIALMNRMFFDTRILAAIFFAAALSLFRFGREKDREMDDAETVGQDIFRPMVICAVFLVAGIYIYSRYINPQGSLFVDRYFIPAAVPVYIVTAIGVDKVIEILGDGRQSGEAGFISALVIAALLVSTGYHQWSEMERFPGIVNQPYEQATNWIYAHSNVNAIWDDALVIIPSPADGLYYYATRDGERENLNFGTLTESNWESYKTVFVALMCGDLTDESKQVLAEHYQEAERNDGLRITVYVKNTND